VSDFHRNTHLWQEGENGPDIWREMQVVPVVLQSGTGCPPPKRLSQAGTVQRVRLEASRMTAL